MALVNWRMSTHTGRISKNKTLNHKMQLWVSGFGQYILQKERYHINRVMYKCSVPHLLLPLCVILAILVWVAILPHCG